MFDINKTVSDLESAKRTALKPSLLSNQNLTHALEINKQLKINFYEWVV